MALLQLPHPLLLASASPRRQELLEQLGVWHHVVAIPTPEGEDEPQLANESPLDYVQRTANEKAQHAFSHLQAHQSLAPQQAILCADTTVELNHQVFGKAATEAEAVAMLSQLSGHTQRVHTAVVIVLEGQYHHALSTSLVTFASLSQHEIQTYCRTGDYQGKAGAYGIQGPAAAFVRHLEGSYSGVMGLPLHETYTLLTQLYPQT